MDYLRQLRNDEKRGTYAEVITLKAGDFPDEATTADGFLLGRLDGKVFVDRAYAVVKEAFPAGSTISFGYINENTGGLVSVLFQDLDLTVVGAVNATVEPDAMIQIQHLGAAEASQPTLDAVNVGEVQFVIEYTEDATTTGSYTK
jgi:hypothetical protein